MSISIVFSSLYHDAHSIENQPGFCAVGYGSACVAAYASEVFKNKVELEYFQYISDLTSYLDENIPEIVCFSNFVWNSRLSCEIARRIKIQSPETIVIFGGPTYPIEAEEQKEWLISHPDIDFYIYREGEKPFAKLCELLLDYDLDVEKFKEDRIKIPNCHYIVKGEFIYGEDSPASREGLDWIPSPYLSGLLDTALSRGLIPVIQTKRGCPFKCTFCESGADFYNLTSGYSFERKRDEFEYIAERSRGSTLMLADLNFGMYKEDAEFCKIIGHHQKATGWPPSVQSFGGKNNKEQVLEAAALVQSPQFLASVQTTDPAILKNIKRQNVSQDVATKLAREVEAMGGFSFSELIMTLPGESKESHFNSAREMIDSGISVLRVHQLYMLPAAEVASKETREKFGMQTRFRIHPKTVFPYQIFGETFYAPEIDEICVGTNTMSFEDYLDCRQLTMVLEIFYNNGIFRELFGFLRNRECSISDFIMRAFEEMKRPDSPLREVFDGFIKENQECWEREEDVLEFLRQPGVIDQYLDGELGNNEQQQYRAMAIFYHLEDVHQIAFDLAAEFLRAKGVFGESERQYLKELLDYCLLEKSKILSDECSAPKTFHFDFNSLKEKINCDDDPMTYYLPEGIKLEFKHTEDQRKLLRATTIEDKPSFSKYTLGVLLSSSNLSRFYRKAHVVA
jgi:radical SAM superfamily enzyme YgiQ (UPF0313 family)